jgi:hypothetical protein
MYQSFESVSNQSRIWIYTASRPFTQEEEKWVADLLKNFCTQWAAHGHPLNSSFKIDRHQFIALAVDEDYHNPSGCSIDSSVGVMRQIHQATGVDMLDRSKVPFFVNERVQLIPAHELKTLFAQGTLHANSITFNTMVATKADLEKQWEILVEKSWLIKYLPKTALTSQQ